MQKRFLHTIYKRKDVTVVTPFCYASGYFLCHIADTKLFTNLIKNDTILTNKMELTEEKNGKGS